MSRALRTALANWIMPRPLLSERLYTGAVGEVMKMNAVLANSKDRAVDPLPMSFDDIVLNCVRNFKT